MRRASAAPRTLRPCVLGLARTDPAQDQRIISDLRNRYSGHCHEVDSAYLPAMGCRSHARMAVTSRGTTGSARGSRPAGFILRFGTCPGGGDPLPGPQYRCESGWRVLAAGTCSDRKPYGPPADLQRRPASGRLPTFAAGTTNHGRGGGSAGAPRNHSRPARRTIRRSGPGPMSADQVRERNRRLASENVPRRKQGSRPRCRMGQRTRPLTHLARVVTFQAPA